MQALALISRGKTHYISDTDFCDFICSSFFLDALWMYGFYLFISHSSIFPQHLEEYLL